MKKKRTKEKNQSILFVCIGIISIYGIYRLWLWNLDYCIGMTFEQRGTFGDMFGAVNSVFSGLAFAGIIITIFLQSRELKLQRHELTETKNEFKQQNLTTKLQRIDNTFFKLIEKRFEIIENIKLFGRSGESALQAFNSFIVHLLEEYDKKGIKHFDLPPNFISNYTPKRILSIHYDNYYLIRRITIFLHFFAL